ncbi:CotH kinase family protein [Algoriphagus sp. SE2]|uniref:CotH kinase family protein n=1 Tax=Algoriphagus sp. SE2 TaxID=3141536 RepID=UPI0031CD0C5E
MKKNLIVFFLFWLGIANSFAQENLGSRDLDFSVISRKIENQIKLDLDGRDYQKLRSINGQKVVLKPLGLIINGQKTLPNDVHTRGQSTLYFPRKSLSFDVESSVEIQHGEINEKMSHFILLSLSMDKYYIRNRLAFGLLQKVGLLDFFFAFTNLQINEKSEGIYMAVQRPQDWAIHDQKSPIVIRRGYLHKIEKSKTSKSISKQDIKSYIESFKSIYKLIRTDSGEELYTKLSEKLDLENYMSWLAVNYLLRNGDYTDEVFFYFDQEINRFKIIPWDYDDIFSVNPHEGSLPNSDSASLLFSKEDDLDAKIAMDPYLFEKYQEVLRKVCLTLSDELLANVFEATYSELYPYYLQEEIIQNVETDLYKDANLEKLRYELTSSFLFLKGRRDFILGKSGN